MCDGAHAGAKQFDKACQWCVESSWGPLLFCPIRAIGYEPGGQARGRTRCDSLILWRHGIA